jgi:dienelactone hydrolase
MLWLCALARAGEPAEITIPALSGPLIIDGKLDDDIWRNAGILSLAPKERSPVSGGEVRIAVRGNYLCMSARLPEPDRVVAHSTGRNPGWWSEDMIKLDLRLYSVAMRRNLNLSLSVNPFGAYEFKGADGIETSTMAAATASPGEWTIEAAIPLDGLSQIGFMHVQRVRASRPEMPELEWNWPAPNEYATMQLAASTVPEAPALYSQAVHSRAAPQTQIPAPAELAWIPGNVWTQSEHERLRVSQMLENSLHARMAVIAEAEKRDWQKVESRESWQHFRDQRLSALRNWLGPMPPRTPLRTAVTHRADSGYGFVIENLVFESRPQLLVTANLYLPEKPSGKVPAIVVVHSHHAPKTQFELQDLGMTWARSGTAVLIMDQLCAGERSQSQPWPRESYYGRYALGNQLLLAGESLMKWMVWDLMRGIDLLLDRPEIDATRIILLGAVAGGGDPAAVTAALDPRVAAAIPFNFGEAGPEEHYTSGPRGYDFETAWPGWGEWETTRCLPRSVVDQFFPWFICASVAPRPFLYSFEIAWPDGVEREPAWTRYQKVFALYRARDLLAEVHGFGPFPGPGECTNVGTLLRKRIYPVLERWFNLPAPGAEFHRPLPEPALRCLTPALAAERNPKSASSMALAMARMSPARSRSLPLAQLRAALREKLGDIEPVRNPNVTPLWTKAVTQVRVEALAIESAPGILVPVYLLKPEGASSIVPVVIAVAQAGKARFLSQRGRDIVALLRRNSAVCLLDVRSTGELAATSGRGPGAMDAAASEFMLGQTLLGAQLKDFRTVLHYLASRSDLDGDHIALWGDSFAETNSADFQFDQSEMQEPGPVPQHQAEPLGALLALLACLYEDHVSAIAARGGLTSFISVLEDRFSHVPEDIVVPGILRTADIPDIIETQRSRPVLLERFVDGRNRPAMPPVKGSPRLTIRENAAEGDVASWLVSHNPAR